MSWIKKLFFALVLVTGFAALASAALVSPALASPAGAGAVRMDDASKAIDACRAASWYRINGVGVASTGEIKVKQALKLCQRAEKLAPKNPKVWAYLSRIHAAAKQYDKSLEYAKKSADAGSAEGMTYMGALYQMGWGVQKDVKDAAKWYRKAADGGSAPAMRNLGWIYRNDIIFSKNIEKAIVLLRKSDNLGDLEGTYRLGLIYLKRKKYGDFYFSLNLFLKIYKHFAKRNSLHSPRMARVYIGMSKAYRNMGNNGDAMKMALNAAKVKLANSIFQSNDSLLKDKEMVDVHVNMGEVLVQLGRYDDALREYFSTLEIINEKKYEYGEEEIGRIFSRIGKAYLESGNLKKADMAFTLALKMFGENMGLYEEHRVSLMEDIALSYVELGNTKRAKGILKIVMLLRMKDHGVHHMSFARTLRSMGMEALRSKDFERAMIVVLRAMVISLAKAGQGDYENLSLMNSGSRDAQELVVDLFGLMAGVYRQRTQTVSSIIFHKIAVNNYRKVLLGNRDLMHDLSPDLVKSFWKKKRPIYQLLSDLLIEQGRISEARQVMKMLKQREFFTYMKHGQADDKAMQIAFTPLEQAVVDQFQVALQTPVSIIRELQKLEAKKRKGHKLSTDEKIRMAQLQKQEEKTLLELRQKMKLIFDGLLKNPDNLQNVLALDDSVQKDLAQLREPTALYQAVTLEDKVHLLIFTSSGAVARKAIISKAELSKKIAAFRKAIEQRGDVKAKGRELYDLLIKPVEADLAASKAKTVLLSLDGILRYLPYAALFDGQKYLVERYSLVLDTPMARPFWRDAAKNWQRAEGYGMSKGARGFSPLPEVAHEVEAIVTGADGKGILTGKAHLDEGFTRKSLVAGLQSFAPVLHIATHFKFDAGYPAGSFLLLGDGSHLNLATIQREPARFDFSSKDLVALSACETAMGKGRALGAEIDGLGALIVSQGGRSVLATLWSVADKSTSQLMQRFYQLRTKDHLGKGLALALAQREFATNAIGSLSGKYGTKHKAKTKPMLLAMNDTGTTVRGSQSVGKRPEPASGQAIKHTEKHPGFSHPYYWAPFVLMGQWN